MVPSKGSGDEYRWEQPTEMPQTLDERSFIEAAFKTVPTEIAIIDEEGTIVYTNRAWQQFGEENGIEGPAHTLGVNYLAICERSTEDTAQAALNGIQSVLDQRQTRFELEYPCHSPDVERWFQMRAVRLRHDGADFVLVLHYNITDRKLSEQRVDAQNAELVTVNKINILIRDIIDSLLKGSDKAEIEATTCGQIASSDLFHSAYVVEKSLDGRLSVQTAAGLRDGSTDIFEVLSQSDFQRKTFEDVFDNREVNTIPDAQSDSLDEFPLGKLARYNGFGASMIVPIHYQSVVHGALVVNADTADKFTESIQSAFGVLCETIGYVFSAIENRRLLFGESVVRVTFEVPASASPLAALSEQASCRVTVDGVVPLDERILRSYLRVEGTTPDVVRPVLAEIDGGYGSKITNVGEDRFVLEWTLTDDSPLITLVDYGAMIESGEAKDGALRLTANIASGTEVRTIVEAVLDRHSGAQFVAKEAVDQSIDSQRGFRSELNRRLTERQREVLTAAYHAGYFKQPRQMTGDEIAEKLGVTRQTFNYHLRHAEETILTQLFEEYV